MFRELIKEREANPVLVEGAYIGRFMGVKLTQRKTFETRNSDTPEYEDCFVFEFEVTDPEVETPFQVAKWVNKPRRLMHPSNGKTSNLYKTLAALYGVPQMTDEQLENAEEFVKQAVGREYTLTLQTKPSGWVDLVHIAPVRKSRRRVADNEETLF